MPHISRIAQPKEKRTCLVDFDNAAVCHLLKEAQQASLIVTYSWVLVLLSDTIYAYGSTR